MSKKDIFYKNAILSIEFSKYVIEHPEFAEKIPKDAQIIFLPQDDPKLCKENLKIANAFRNNGKSVALIKIEKLASKNQNLG